MKRKGHKSIDPQVFIDALNRATDDPEFKARYKKWLEDIGPECWTPVAKADYEAIVAEEAAAKDSKAKA